jgi:hypothetical protein
MRFVEANSLQQPEDNWKLFLPNNQVFHEISSLIIKTKRKSMSNFL